MTGTDGPPDLDLGSGVVAWWTAYLDHPRAGLVERHADPLNGAECWGGVLFDLPGIRDAFPGRSVWQVEQLEPLTLTPSLLCRNCTMHGWIRDGRWVPA